MSNRSFHPDNWPAWFDEAEDWNEAPITDGARVDRLYDAYLAGDAPLYAVMALDHPPGLRPIAIPTARVFGQVEAAYEAAARERGAAWARIRAGYRRAQWVVLAGILVMVGTALLLGLS